MVRVKNTYAFEQTVQHLHSTIHENGFVRTIVYVLPNLTTAVSGVLTVYDTDGNLIYTSGTINENASTLVADLSIPIDYGYTTTFTLNAASGKAGTDTCYAFMYVEDV